MARATQPALPGLEPPLTPRQALRRWEEELCAHWGAIAEQLEAGGASIGPDGLTEDDLAAYPEFPDFDSWLAQKHIALPT